MNIGDIAPKFADIESRLKSLEATQHSHEDPIPETEEVVSEAAEEVVEDAAKLTESICTPDPEEATAVDAPEETPEVVDPPEIPAKSEAKLPIKETAGEGSEDADATFRASERTAVDPHEVLKVAIQSDVKAYDANTIAQALLHEVIAPKDNRKQCRENVMVIENGETIPVQPFRLTDATYKVVSRQMLGRILEETAVDAIEWQAEGYDCEDIARKFVTRCCDLGINSVGRVMAWSGGHAFCVAVVQDGASVDFVFIEPQTDKIVEKFEGMYDISDALIIIS